MGRAYRFHTDGARWPLVAAAIGSTFLVGTFVIDMVFSRQAPILAPLSAAVGALVVVAATARLHYGPVIWYTMQTSGDMIRFTEEASGESVEVQNPRQHTSSLWWGRLAPVFFGVVSGLQLTRPAPFWAIFAAIAVMGAADAWLYPPGRRPLRTVRAHIDGRLRRMFVVAD